MKKLKLLPTVLMLVLCVGILAIGIYAITPSKNTIDGTITVNASNAPVTIKIFQNSIDGTKVAEAVVRTQKTMSIGDLTFKTKDGKSATNANKIDDIAPIVYVVEFSTTSTKNLVIDTETIEQYDGISLTDETEVVKENIVSVTKLHEPTATDKVTGKSGTELAYFTNNKPYTITLTIKQAEFVSEECKVKLNMNFEIWEATEYNGVGINGVDYLYFGEYPQSEAKTTGSASDGTLKLASNNKALTNTGEVYTSYESQVLYDDKGNATAEDTTNNIYTDEDNNKYVEVSYCYETIVDTTEVIQTEHTKYFLIEPLKWRILKNKFDNEGNYSSTLLMSSTVVEQVEFNHESENFDPEMKGYVAINKDGSYVLDKNNNKVYANNYEYSFLRTYLKDTFYNNAFNNLQKQLIKILDIDNSIETMGTNELTNRYVCNDILADNGEGDPVFALSFADVFNTEYGFENNTHEYEYTSIDGQTYKGLAGEDTESLSRMASASAYAGATGAFAITLQQIIDMGKLNGFNCDTRKEIIAFAMLLGIDEGLATTAVDNGGMGAWWLRSPGLSRDESYIALPVFGAGNVIRFAGRVEGNYGGVGALPALHISLKG